MKVLVVLNNVRIDYANKKTNKFDFFGCRTGKELYKKLTAPKVGLGLPVKDVQIVFAYPRVPEITASGKYKPILAGKLKPYALDLIKRIVTTKPDLIISMGSVALQALTGHKGIEKYRGIPVHQKFVTTLDNGTEDSFTTWMFPTYSIENVNTRPAKRPMYESDFSLIKNFIKEGEKAFKANTGSYELVNTFDKVQEMFQFLQTQGQSPDTPIAMDFETNSLHGNDLQVPNKNSVLARKVYGNFVDTSDTVSAKPILLSLSYKEGQGWAVPLDHKQAPWTSEQLEYIYNEIKRLFSDQRWIVGHNIKFDIKFCMDTIGLQQAVRCMDTLLLYYVGVSEENSVTKGLKVLAYQYTNMGGYDNALANYKTKLLTKARTVWTQYFEKHEYLENNKVVKMTKSRYQPPINEVDGGNFNYEWIPLDILYAYAAGDTDCTLRIFNQLKPVINEYPKWVDLIENFYPKLEDALCSLEHNGTYLDKSVAKRYAQDYRDEEVRVEAEMRKQVPEIPMLEQQRREKLQKLLRLQKQVPSKDRATTMTSDVVGGVEKKISVAAYIDHYKKYKGTKKDPEAKIRYRPSSPKQNQYLLYVVLGYQLPVDKKFITTTALDRLGTNLEQATWQDYKADMKEALPYLVEQENSVLAKYLMYYSKLRKARTAFLEKLPLETDSRGFIHTLFNPSGTVTSRLTSSEPNLQQLPRPTGDYSRFDYHHSVKTLFISRFKDGCLLNIDFKSLEIYIAGMLSKDETISQILLDGKDYHEMTARNIWGIPDDQPVSSDTRSKAKAASFGINYGQSAQGLADREGISVQDAEDVIDGVMRAYPKLKALIEQVNQQAKAKHYVETISGFRRRLANVTSKDQSVVNRTLREAFNSVIQGSGAYCTNSALILLREIFLENKLESKIILTVHDSVVIDCTAKELPVVAIIAQACFAKLPIPVLCNNDIGNLKVPKELQLGNGKFRYPLHGEIEIGLNYGDEVDYDPEDYKTFKSPKGYCDYYTQLQHAKDQEATYKKSDPEQAQQAVLKQQQIKSEKASYQQLS